VCGLFILCPPVTSNGS